MLAKEQVADELSPLALVCFSEWLISQLAGLDTGEPGFQNIRLRPQIPDKETLSSAAAHYTSANGRISTHWHYASDGLRFDVTIPPNTTALCELPIGLSGHITEGGNEVAASGKFFDYQQRGQVASFQAGPGSYSFLIQQKTASK